MHKCNDHYPKKNFLPIIPALCSRFFKHLSFSKYAGIIYQCLLSGDPHLTLRVMVPPAPPTLSLTTCDITSPNFYCACSDYHVYKGCDQFPAAVNVEKGNKIDRHTRGNVSKPRVQIMHPNCGCSAIVNRGE